MGILVSLGKMTIFDFQVLNHGAKWKYLLFSGSTENHDFVLQRESVQII